MFSLTVGGGGIVSFKFWQCWRRQLVGLNSGALFAWSGDPLEGYYLEWMSWTCSQEWRVKCNLAMLPTGTCDSDKDFPVVRWRMIPAAPSFACSPWACLEVPVTWLILFELEITHLIIIWSAADAWLLNPKWLFFFFKTRAELIYSLSLLDTFNLMNEAAHTNKSLHTGMLCTRCECHVVQCN